MGKKTTVNCYLTTVSSTLPDCDHTIILANKFPYMLGCSSRLPTERAFLIHSLFQLQKSTCCHGAGRLMELCRFFFFILSQLRLLCLPFLTIFVACNKDSFFFCKKCTEKELRYTLLCACSITDASLLRVFFHITHESIQDHCLLAVACYINSARALLLAAEVTFFPHLISCSHFSHPNFTNCKLQNTRILPDTDHC